MKTQIVNMIEKCGGEVTFVELMKIPGFEGREAIGRSEYNVVFWVDVSCDAVAALHDLFVEEVVVMKLTDVVPYIIDGQTLKLPLAKRVMRYKWTRWLPVFVDKGPKFNQYMTDVVGSGVNG